MDGCRLVGGGGARDFVRPLSCIVLVLSFVPRKRHWFLIGCGDFFWVLGAIFPTLVSQHLDGVFLSPAAPQRLPGCLAANRIFRFGKHDTAVSTQ